MAAWDGQGRPEWGHGVNRRERRADGTLLFARFFVLGVLASSYLFFLSFPRDDDAFALYVSSVFLLSVLGRDHKASLIIVVSETPLVALSSFATKAQKALFPMISRRFR